MITGYRPTRYRIKLTSRGQFIDCQFVTTLCTQACSTPGGESADRLRDWRTESCAVALDLLRAVPQWRRGGGGSFLSFIVGGQTKSLSNAISIFILSLSALKELPPSKRGRTRNQLSCSPSARPAPCTACMSILPVAAEAGGRGRQQQVVETRETLTNWSRAFLQ